jgi:sodium/hydrogen exchanger 8
MIILVGMLAGFIVDLCSSVPNDENMADDVAQSLLSFSPTTFFIVLLPPIIFNSGYHIRRDLFFRYVAPICLYACVGTAICTMVVAGILYAAKEMFSFEVSLLELLAFGALISATDPVSTLAIFSSKRVDPHLFYLVFGESVINDAVGLVLFEALAHLIEYQSEDELAVGQEVGQFLFDFFTGFCGSLCLGTLFGLAVAYFLKKIDMRSTPILELCIYVVIMYFPFVVAEILRLSGIVTVLFTGIAAQRYAVPNLSAATVQNADTVFRLTAHLTETIIFLELGLSVFGLVGTGAFHIGFIGAALGACLLGRALNIYPITFLFNLFAKDDVVKDTSTKDSSGMDYVEKCDGESSLVKTDDINMPISDAKIPWRTAHMLWFSGLRGAVSYALVRNFPNASGNRDIFVVTTIFVVLVTTFVLGGSTEWALKGLGIPLDVDESKHLKSLPPRQLLPGMLRRFENYHLRSWVIRNFERRLREEGTVADDPSEAADYYEEHVEMTEQQHLHNVDKKSSVYDFGH